MFKDNFFYILEYLCVRYKTSNFNNLTELIQSIQNARAAKKQSISFKKEINTKKKIIFTAAFAPNIITIVNI